MLELRWHGSASNTLMALHPSAWLTRVWRWDVPPGMSADLPPPTEEGFSLRLWPATGKGLAPLTF